jgi:hypothetical protein
MIPIIGGKLDGQMSATGPGVLTLRDKGEDYLLISYKTGTKDTPGDPTVTRYFYMLAGMTPLDALKIDKERRATMDAFEKLTPP